MKRVVVFQGLGVAQPDVPMPDGVWQRGEPVPARTAAIWYRTQNLVDQSRFPQSNPTPAANCRMCPPGDLSPDCCVSSNPMRQYIDWGKGAYESAYKPWNHNSFEYQQPPTTNEVLGQALEQSLRQAQLELATPANAPLVDPSAKLAGFIGSGGQGQTHLLGTNHLLGYTPRYSPFGCTSCNQGGSLAGTFTNDDGSFTTTGKAAVGVGVVAALGIAYLAFRKKRR